MVLGTRTTPNEPPTCQKCGAEHDRTAGHYVAPRVIPGNVQSKTYCAECYADLLEKETYLAKRESQAYAYSLHALNTTDIAYIIERKEGTEIDRTTVSKHLARAANKLAKAVRTVEALEPTAFAASEAPRYLSPGTVIRLKPDWAITAPSNPEYSDCTFDHAIVKKIFGRGEGVTPDRLAVYAFDPQTDTIRMDSHNGVPVVIDITVEAIDKVLVPATEGFQTEITQAHLNQ